MLLSCHCWLTPTTSSCIKAPVYDLNYSKRVVVEDPTLLYKNYKIFGFLQIAHFNIYINFD